MDFQKIYESYFRSIFSYIVMRIKEESLAEDIASTVWYKVYTKIDTFDQNKGNLGQWLFGIARNEINMHSRLYYVRKFISFGFLGESVPSHDADVSFSIESKELHQALVIALSKLSKKEQDVMTLKFYSELNNREIAKLVKLSESNVGTIINRGINKLRVLLEEI